MGTPGAITQNIDIAQFVLYMFWIFFAGLIYYLVRENHREGYPMETESGRGRIGGWPVPGPKVYKTPHGDVTVPNGVPQQALAAQPAHGWAGAALVPTGNPMLDGVGPGSWAARADVPDETYEGLPKVVPMRTVAADYGIVQGDTDPRGLSVVGADGVSGGKVVDLWVDTAENLFRYLEVQTTGTGRRVLLPMNFARVTRREVRVQAITGEQFALVPGRRQADIVTMLEEEKIQAYYGGGTLYAVPGRTEPLL